MAEAAKVSTTVEVGEGWLQERQEAFRQRFSETGMPAPFEEDWRGTDLRLIGLGVSDTETPAAIQLDKTGEESLLCFDSAVKHQPELLQSYLFSCFPPETAPGLAALNAARINGGAFFHLPGGTEMCDTARIHSRTSGSDGTSFQRNLVVAEAGSCGSLVERFEGDGTGCPVTEVVVGPGAQLDLLTLIDPDETAGCCYTGAARVAGGGRLRWFVGSGGGRMVRADIEVTLAGPEAESRIIGIGAGSGRQHLDHRTVQRHAAPDTKSTIVFGTLLRGRCRSIYRGLIGMDQNAQRGHAYQKNDNLLLERGPTAEAIPKLEILTDDVKCSHGSTVGRLSEDELFYATARGISRTRARDMVAEGFIRRVLTGGGAWSGLADELFETARRWVIEEGREQL